MRVLHLGKFYPPARGGIESHLETLCRRLADRLEIEVIVANAARTLLAEVIDGVRVRRLARSLTVAGAPICPRLISELRRTPADIVHLHAPNPPAMIAFLLSRHPAPLVITWHSDIVRQRAMGFVFRPIEQAALRRAAAVIASSPDYPAASPALIPHRERTRVIPFGIDCEPFRAADADGAAQLKRRYHKPIVLGVGRLIYYKGFDFLIRAMRSVDAQLVLIGEGPLRPSLERLAAELGLRERVSLLGERPYDELIAHYHAAEVFVLPSIARSEAFGIVQLEAMACGKPVVNTRIASGVPFVSRDGETGITVEPRSSDALARAINVLLANRELAARYGAAGQRRVRDHFGADLMASRVTELYRSVLSRAGEGDSAQVAH